MLQVSIDTGGLEWKIEKTAHKYGVDMRSLYYDQMRLWLQDLVKRVPPYPSKNSALGLKKEAQRTGDRAVERDFWKLFKQTMTRRGVSASGAAQIHAQARNKRTGRVDGRRKRLPVSFSVFRRIVRESQKHVGTLKAGWVRAAEYFRGKCGGRLTVPAWVRRNMGRAASMYYDRMGRDGNGFLKAVNSVNWASFNKSVGSAIKFTLRIREEDLTKRATYNVKRVAKQINQLKAA